MWRIVLGAALLLMLALGASAAACPTCGAKTLVSGVTIDATDSAQSLIFLVQPAPGQALPDQGTAVVMQFNGNRSKCLNVPVLKGTIDNAGNAVYRGSVPAFYGG